jgi:hypothetical protein
MSEQENDDEHDENEEDEEETEDEHLSPEKPEYLIDQIASDDDQLIYELQSYEDHEEIVIFDESDGAKPDTCVVLATSVEELDEAIEILQELREKMVEVAKKKGRT